MAQEVSVDNDFARFGSKSYAINKINSVEVRERRPHGMGGAFICGIICIILLTAAVSDPSVGIFVLACIMGLAAAFQVQRAKIREYQLFVMTSSSEAQAFVSEDKNEVMSLREQIEAAMIRQSRVGLAS